MAHAESVHFIGLDLAWGPRNRTGIAVVDGSGSLQVLRTRITDDDIATVLAPYLDDEVLVGIDAPLLVTNDSGRRLAEAELDLQFRAFQAGPYPANRTHQSGMFNPPRGFTLCQRLGLDIDPRSDGRRRAIEVYPHPATIALFQLTCTLKYKAGRGETPRERFADRKVEMGRLVRFVEGLADASPSLRAFENERWLELVTAVNDASRPAQLDWVEDQIDGVLCAYIAMYFTRNRDDTTIFGNYPENGYIVTPSLPVDLVADCTSHSKPSTAPREVVAEVYSSITDSEEGVATSRPHCPCGCGQTVARRDRFAPGHDARALHSRIAQQWGNTLGFVRWFDETYGREQP